MKFSLCRKINKKVFRISCALSVCTLSLTACFHDESDTFVASTQTISNVSAVGYTYHSPDGNRLVEGAGSINTLPYIDIPLPSSVSWIAAVASGQDSYWTAVLDDGSVKAFKVYGQQAGETAKTYEEVSISPSQLGMPIPPTLVLENENTLKLGNVFGDASVNTSSVILNDKGDRAFITNNGSLVLETENAENFLAINALPYSRILVDEQQRLLVLTKPTTRYDHIFVLGSSYAHASAITLIQTTPEFKVLDTIDIPAPDVIEGNALIWTDVDVESSGNANSKREIITTLAKGAEGARLVIFNEDGSIRESSEAINSSHRWRHQVAVAPFKSADEKGIVALKIPHYTATLEYFRLDDDSMLETKASVSHSSHLSTGINIDMGIMGDFDGDARTEILIVKSGTRDSIGAYEYSIDNVNSNGIAGIALDWSLPLAGVISSNVAAATLADDSIAYGVGQKGQGNSLRIWHP